MHEGLKVYRIDGSNECSQNGKLGIEQGFCVERGGWAWWDFFLLWDLPNVLLETVSLWRVT